MTPGYRALRESAATIPLRDRGRIRVTGEDRVRLLHAMASNDIQHLRPGSGCYTFFLNAQGRVLCDAVVLAFEDHLLLSTEPEARVFLREHLDRYIIADDVSLEDVTDGTVEIAVEGPRAEAPVALPSEPYSHVPLGPATVVRASVTGQPGRRLIAPSSFVAAAAAVEASAEDVRAVRIENGVPRFPEDFSERYLAHETQLLHAVHFDKGCYLGQEIVERVRARGGVHRFLTRIAAAEPAAPGTKILAGDKEAGEVTSMVISPAQGRAVGFAYIREEYARAPLAIRGARVEVLGPPARV